MHDVLSIPRSEVLAELFKRGRFEPICTKEGALHAKQLLALQILTDSTTKEFAYGGAAGGAKSWTGCAWLAFMCKCYPDTRYFMGREELKRITESTLITFYKVCKAYGITGWKYNGQYHYIIFDNGSRIDLLDLKLLPSDPMYERYGSIEYTAGWIEEAGEINIMAYDTLKTRVGRQNNGRYGILPKIFVTLNPKKNWTHKVFWKPFKSGNMPAHVKFLQAFVQDNPFIEKDYIANLENITDKVQRQRLLYGNFDYDDDSAALCSYDKICDIFTNYHVSKGKKYITADVARHGGDKITIANWSGLRGRIRWFVKKPLDYTLAEIEKERKSSGIGVSSVLVDDGGLGGGITDFGKYKGFINNASPLPSPTQPGGQKLVKENFDNLKSQCGYRLADVINNNELFIDCQDEQLQEWIIEELEACLKMKNPDGDGKKALIPKDGDKGAKQALGRSPDFFDVINERMYFELVETEYSGGWA